MAAARNYRCGMSDVCMLYMALITGADCSSGFALSSGASAPATFGLVRIQRG